MGDDALKISRKKEEILAQTPWLNIYYDDVVFPGGKEGKYIRLVEKGGNGIVIIPINAKGEIGLVNLYRYAISDFSWELPRGFGEGVAPEENAARELSEELQMTFSSVEHIGRLFSNTGLASNATDVVCVKGLDPDSKAVSDPREAIKHIRFFSAGQVGDMIRDGSIRDGFTLSALMIAFANSVIDLSNKIA